MSKLYTITSNYSQGSQAQIQGTHASDELLLKFLEQYTGNPLGDIFFKWLKEDKTRVDLKINSPKDIEKMADFFHNYSKDLSIPYAIFQEPELNNSTTAISFVGPDDLCHPIQSAVTDLFYAASKGCSNVYSFLDFKGVYELYSILCDRDNVNKIQFKNCNFVFVDLELSEIVTVKYRDYHNNEVSVNLNLAQLEFYRTVRNLPLSK